VYVVTSSGRPAWSARVGQRVTTPPAFATDGTLYVAADGLYAFAPDSTPRWHTPTSFTWRGEVPRTEPSAITAGPLIGPDGTIYAGGDRNRVYAFRPDGAPRWVHALGDEDSNVWQVAQLSFLDGALVVASHGIVALPVPGAARQIVRKAASYD
jgi:outer membrane protein assembly factor BamB